MWETTIAVGWNLGLGVDDTKQAVAAFLDLAEISVVAVPPEAWAMAVDAYDRFGKSRYPAALNFGDCFAFACARQARLPLLCKGDDLPQTDIESA